MDPIKKGALTEERFLEALKVRTSATPDWFVKIERASPRADVEGFDFFAVIRTKEKPEGMSVPVQVKSSKGGVEQYFLKRPRYKRKGVLVIDIYYRQKPEAIRAKTYRALEPYLDYQKYHFARFFENLFKRRLSRKGEKMKEKIKKTRKG